MASPLRVEYASEPRKPRDSAWSLVGFGLALLAASASAASWWSYWRGVRGGATANMSFGVSPLYYLVTAAVAAACVTGMVRGRKRFAILGLVVLLAGVAAMVVLVVGSPWATGPRATPIPYSGR